MFQHKKQTKLHSASCFTLRCASIKFRLKWNGKYLISGTQSLGYNTQQDKGDGSSGSVYHKNVNRKIARLYLVSAI